MMSQSLESQIIAKVAEDYRRRGYEVEVEPKETSLPDFLDGYRPDLIARNSTESVVVEVKIGTRTSVVERLRDVAERVNRQPGWRFSLVFVSPEQPDQISEVRPAPLSILEKRASNADALLKSGQSEGAFLLLWSVLEGILRILSHHAQLPLESLPTSTLIRELYSAGELDMDQFETLMQVLPIRNQLVHGCETPKETFDVEQLRRLVDVFIAEARQSNLAQLSQLASI